VESQITITSIIIIVWLIFPGVVFKRFYYKGQFAKQFGVGLFADRLITSIFWGIIVQIITFLIYSKYFGFTYTGIKSKVVTVYASVSSNKIPDISYDNLEYILGYLAFLIFTSFCLGSLFHFLIRYFKIDLKYPVFRFSNHWNYYFRGEIASMREFKSLKAGKWLTTMVDVVIEDGSENNKLISGFLTQHTISQKTGELEAIYLTGASRYSKNEGKFKPIPGDCVIIPFSKVIDLNLRYTFKVLTDEQKNTIKYDRITSLPFVTISLLIIVFPWFLKINAFLKILGILLGWLTWVMLLMLISNPFKPKDKLSSKMLWTLFVIMVVFLILTLLTLQITPSWEQIKNIF
jgi:hypothetical protein